MNIIAVDDETNIRPYISALKKTLEEAGVEGMIIKDFNSIAVDTSGFDCDLYRFLKMDALAVNEYNGEYMAQYSWGEFMTGYLDDKVKPAVTMTSAAATAATTTAPTPAPAIETSPTAPMAPAAPITATSPTSATEP